MNRVSVPSSLLYSAAVLCAFCAAGSANLTPIGLPQIALIGAAGLLGWAAARTEALEDAPLPMAADDGQTLPAASPEQPVQPQPTLCSCTDCGRNQPLASCPECRGEGQVSA